MKQIIHFHISKGAKQYVASGVELPIVTQALTLDKLAKNIREATALHLESEDAESLGFTRTPAVHASLEIEALQSA